MAATRNQYERSLLMLLLETGPRIGEVEGIRHADLVNGFLRVVGKTGERLVPITEAMFHQFQAMPTDCLFPRRRGPGYPAADIPAKRSTLASIVRRVLEHANVRGPKTGPHTFRHTFATYYVQQTNGDLTSLMKIMGWTSMRMAERYVGLDTSKLLAVHHERSP